MGFEDARNTGLCLGLGSLDRSENHQQSHHQQNKKLSQRFDHFFPSLTLGLSSEEKYQTALHDQSTVSYRQASSLSAVSSYSNSSVKRERDLSGEEVEIEVELETEKVTSKGSDENEEGSLRKKLRLTKEQSVILEDSFKEHSTLNPKQKQALAKQLNLRPRQVEVWFQNRRARTKLKQTEVDCELLKKCCESLTDENRRLQKELQELKALKLTAPFYMQLPAATLTMCPSCERIGGGGENASKSPFPMATQTHFCNPFTHPSAAC
ncbi:hypothetical protein F0562_035782 [Nyssa sinensis]|uniref:Homeobox domain-containing protein n=1 Tax=Nyssa sinensis TaxID=561372 RepID=A0A5J5AG55_9ASTE|nr:hypothetical protein F0562_035782 [Nyssa sinensis]